MASDGVSTLLKEFREAAGLFRELIDEKMAPRVITHNDADGLTAGAVLHRALNRERLPVHTRSLKQLEATTIEDIAKEKPELVIFVDLGSGQLEEIREQLLGKSKVFVLDHHQPTDVVHEDLVHVNPHNCGIDGAREVSGSGMGYLFTRELNQKNQDLAGLAIVGAIGDIQDADGELKGMNREILRDATEAEVIKVEKDLRLYGRQTRPLYKSLVYTTEPFIPGLSGRESACVQFLSDLDITLKKDGNFTMLADLDQEERRRLTEALILKMIENRVHPKFAESIVGEVYTLLKEEKRTPLRDAKEYATLLNGSGRTEHYGIGLAIALGERSNLYAQSLDMLKEHKSYLSECYTWIRENHKRIKDGEVLYYFHVKDEIDENVIGTVASMVLNSRSLNPIKPIIAFSYTREGDVKVSSRGTKELIEKGLNLGKAMHIASKKIGGEGGGHDIAAGAKIGKGLEEEFIECVKEEIRGQIPP